MVEIQVGSDKRKNRILCRKCNVLLYLHVVLKWKWNENVIQKGKNSHKMSRAGQNIFFSMPMQVFFSCCCTLLTGLIIFYWTKTGLLFVSRFSWFRFVHMHALFISLILHACTCLINLANFNRSLYQGNLIDVSIHNWSCFISFTLHFSFIKNQ